MSRRIGSQVNSAGLVRDVGLSPLRGLTPRSPGWCERRVSVFDLLGFRAPHPFEVAHRKSQRSCRSIAGRLGFGRWSRSYPDCCCGYCRSQLLPRCKDRFERSGARRRNHAQTAGTGISMPSMRRAPANTAVKDSVLRIAAIRLRRAGQKRMPRQTRQAGRPEQHQDARAQNH